MQCYLIFFFLHNNQEESKLVLCISSIMPLLSQITLVICVTLAIWFVIPIFLRWLFPLQFYLHISCTKKRGITSKLSSSQGILQNAQHIVNSNWSNGVTWPPGHKVGWEQCFIWAHGYPRANLVVLDRKDSD